ncbi:hypothetical protein BGX30_014773 [Mortierella sp. GBA39]|nr:hypothetical protein BGX30_014773 [Mortierella sp. GBA39]
MYAELPTVLIVGTSVGYLILGMLLYKTNTSFEIYERAPEVKTLGAAMYFNATVANQFKQCGIYDGFVPLIKFISMINVCNEQRESEYKIDFDGHDENLSAKLLKNKRPSPSDVFPLPFSTVCRVGQTRPLIPEEFPDVALEDCQFRKIGRDF